MSVHELYGQLYTEHGPDLKSLGWSSIGAQLRRFGMLSLALQHPGSVLDVGCGFGDFSMYSNAADYTGIDQSQEFIDEAQRKYPTKTFICDDFLTHRFNNKFDYVIGNGILAYQENPVEFIQRMWDLTTNTLAFTWFKTSRNDINLVLSMCECEFYSIRHDYMRDDTTIFMHRILNVAS